MVSISNNTTFDKNEIIVFTDICTEAVTLNVNT